MHGCNLSCATFNKYITTCGSWWKISLRELASVAVLLSLSQAAPSGLVLVVVFFSFTCKNGSLNGLMIDTVE